MCTIQFGGLVTPKLAVCLAFPLIMVVVCYGSDNP